MTADEPPTMPHGLICGESPELARGDHVADDEGALTDAPEAFAALEVGSIAFGGGEAEQCCGVVGFAGLLLVGDLGGAVAEEAAGQGAGPAVVIADGVEVGELVETSRWAMPRPRESFHWACMRARRAGWRIRRQASL